MENQNNNSPSFDGIHRQPVDRVASMLFSKGVKYNECSKNTYPHWEVVPPLRKPPADAPNPIGYKFGRFTVIGLHATMRGSWVVRCSCGDYETRKFKSIYNPSNFGDRCEKCRKVASVRKYYELRTTGIELDTRNL